MAVGVVLDSVFLKLYKRSWANKSQDPILSESRIFFSVWINDAALLESKMLYNIHALKLRQLKGYSIPSREFAELFRKKFKPFEKKWNNVTTQFGPLTLMQGWEKIDIENFEDELVKLANNFLQIDHLIDNTLETFKKPL